MSGLRVLHAPTHTGGNPGALAAAEREVGLRSWSLAYGKHGFQFACDEDAWAGARTLVGQELRRWPVLRRALRDYDVVHFNFGQTLLPSWGPLIGVPPRDCSRGKKALIGLWQAYGAAFDLKDLPLLRAAGRTLAVTFQGDDARQGDRCRELFEIHPADEAGPDYYTPRSDARKRWRIATFDRHAHLLYTVNPDLLHVLPRRTRFVPYASVDPRAWKPVPPKARGTPLVVHAPSHRGVKGTRFLLDAVERLRKEGIDFDFQLVEGMPHHEARRLYERADLVVDQLLCGWYGALALECMALGKPVVCYIREADLDRIPAGMRRELPLLQAMPHTVEDVLRTWLTERRDELPVAGALGRAYAEAWHDPLRIAAQLKRDYEEVRGKGLDRA